MGSTTEPQAAPNKRVIDRLKKILALANSPIPPDASDAMRQAMEAEATKAAEVAQQLMADYNLSMAELGAAGGAEQEGSARTKDLHTRSAMYTYWRKLWEACAKVNYCWYEAVKVGDWKETAGGDWKFHYRTHHHQFIGREVNVAATKVLGEYLEETVNRLCPFKPGKSSSKSQVSWKEGCVDRLAERLHAQKTEIEARDQQQREQAGIANVATAITLRSVVQLEEDENYAFVHGREALLRRQSWRHDYKTCPCRFCLDRKSTMEQIDARPLPTVVVEEKPETPAQRRKREEREQREYERSEQRYQRQQEKESKRLDWRAYDRGREAAESISLNKQVKSGGSTKTLGE